MTGAQSSERVQDAWADRFDALMGLENDAWDIAYDALKAEWQAAYDKEFVGYAVARGWTQENAETWPSEINDDAFLSRDQHHHDPIETARYDVRQCELGAEHDA